MSILLFGPHHRNIMSHSPYSFEFHIHGHVQLRQDVLRETVIEALAPLWQYGDEKSSKKGLASFYNEEPGIEYEDGVGLLSFCWSTQANEDFREVVTEVCLNLNELALAGAALEVSLNDAEFDDEEDSDTEPRDELFMIFIGPTPDAIFQIQRDVLIQDVVSVMERHFQRSELSPVTDAIKKIFDKRLKEVTESLDVNKIGKDQTGLLLTNFPDRNPRRLH
jgi:hypothetical protein